MKQQPPTVAEQHSIDPNDPNQSPREQEGLLPNKLAQTEGQPSAFAGMDTGTPTGDGPAYSEEGKTTSRVNHVAPDERNIPGESKD